MFNVQFNGFKTEEQARTFISWYGGQGEQCEGLAMILEEIGVQCINEDSMNVHVDGGYKMTNGDTLHVPLKVYLRD